jgi:hypothetical protein
MAPIVIATQPTERTTKERKDTSPDNEDLVMRKRYPNLHYGKRRYHLGL